eukprot:2043766-Rhodomonas_salina.4
MRARLPGDQRLGGAVEHVTGRARPVPNLLPVPLCTVLRRCYAQSGTDVAYAATSMVYTFFFHVVVTTILVSAPLRKRLQHRAFPVQSVCVSRTVCVRFPYSLCAFPAQSV